MRIPSLIKSTLKPTKRGVYVTNIGGKKFNLGSDLVQAYQRREWIGKIWQHNFQQTMSLVWSSDVLSIARQIEVTGRAIVQTTSPEQWIAEGNGQWSPPDYSYLDRMRADGIPIETVGGGQYVARLPDVTIGKTNKPAKTRMVKALELYKEKCEAEYPGIYQGGKQQERTHNSIIDYFKKDNLWLHEVTFDVAQTFCNHFRGRPITKKSERGSKKWCEKVIGEFKNALKSFRRNYPEEFTFPDLDSLHKKIVDLPSDKKKNSISKNFFDADEARILFQKADPIIKLSLAVGINCCAGAAELGRMLASEFSFNIEHYAAKKIKFEGKHSFYVGTRRKANTHHEALLWPWVAELVQEQVAKCKANGWKYLFTDDDGEPLYRCNEVYADVGLELPNTTKPEARFVGRFRKLKTDLSFGKLRKSYSNYLRMNKSDDIATLALAHKTKTDDLLHHYTNMPFMRLFEATIASEEHWKLV